MNVPPTGAKDMEKKIATKDWLISVTPYDDGKFGVWLRPFGQDRVSFNVNRSTAVKIMESLDKQLNLSSSQPFHITPGNVRIELTLREAVELVDCLQNALA
jgi:hypothetical protein